MLDSLFCKLVMGYLKMQGSLVNSQYFAMGNLKMQGK